MKAGIYTGKALSVGIGESKEKKTLFVAVNVQMKEGVLQWSGWLSEKAVEHTKKTLEVMGFKGDDLSCFAEGKGLDFNKEFEVTVEEEVYQDKVYPKIKWINEKGGNKSAMLSKDDALMKLASLGLAKKQKPADDVDF